MANNYWQEALDAVSFEVPATGIGLGAVGSLARGQVGPGSTAKFICNSRPRRFGKSITADMLTAYYCKGCSSEEMFSSLEIGQAPDFTKYLNQYDVIHLDIQWCMEPAGGPENVVSYITEKTILELRNYYPEILPACGE